MNEEHIIDLLNAVLGMSIGEVRQLREKHFSPSTVHRYDDGWLVLPDQLADRRQAKQQEGIGWLFKSCEDLADFLTGNLRDHHRFIILGDRLWA